MYNQDSKKEYGGFFPLETGHGREFYSDFENSMLRLNCGRSAIVQAVRDSGCSKLYIPLYLCISVADALKKNGIEFSFYHINEEFLPQEVELKKDEMLLWPDYYGICAAQAEKLAEKYEPRQLIFDNTQAFFSAPVPQAYNVYSCRKFFGVADGAYLIHEGIRKPSLKQDRSAEASLYMLKALEEGTNAAYALSKENEQRIEDSEILEMSPLTRALLCSADYEKAKQARISNFSELHSILGSSNGLNITQAAPGIAYPYLRESDTLRKKLVDSKVYVPQWWKWVAESGEATPFEEYISEYLLPIPTDQRYSVSDMMDIVRTISGNEEIC